MKAIITIVLLITFASCTKERPNCHTCSFGTINGIRKPDTTICGTLPTNFQDEFGNDLSFSCKLR